jgi:hypothetical protein
MSDRPPPERFAFTLVALPSPRPAALRVRELLKLALRRCGLKAERVEPLEPPGTPPPAA